MPTAAPLAEAEKRAADCVQVFLSNPQGWKGPKARADADELRAAAAPVYVHAPYLINVATPNAQVRDPSRLLLQQTCEAAAAVGAAGVVVHGGQVGADGDPEQGLRNWREAVEQLESDVPVLIENTAGGRSAMARSLEQLARLWEALDGLAVGFCLDTCHLQAAGEELAGAVERLRALLGGIDLVHVNDSKDPPGSGRDRHENLGAGTIAPELLVEIVGRAEAPAVCETPGGAEAQAADIAWLRARLPES